jgi:hypothetical protein
MESVHGSYADPVPVGSGSEKHRSGCGLFEGEKQYNWDNLNIKMVNFLLKETVS